MKSFAVFLIGMFFVLGNYPSNSQAPAQPTSTQMTAEKWREDLKFMTAEVERVHKNVYHKVSRQNFADAVKALDARIPSMEDHQIVVEMMRLVASIGDGHTGVRWGMIASTGVFPVIFYVYDDGIYVQKAAAEHSAIVGGKVVKVGNTPVKDAVERLTPYIWRDNEMGIKSGVPWHFTSPKMLHAIGLSPSKESTEFTILKDGRESKIELKPSAKLEDIGNPPAVWVDARAADRLVPAWQKEPRNNFRYEVFEDSKTLYVPFHSVQDKPNETVEAFFGRVFAFAEKSPVERLVLDMRRNGGGNNYLNLPLIIGAIRSRLNVRGKFFVIIGRETFSAAQNAVNDLEKYTNAVFVGEPTGASPNHYGDAQNIELPNSKLRLRASTLWWQDMDPRDDRKWKAPDVAADLTSEHYRNGRDPAMEAILGYKIAKTMDEIITEARSDQNVPTFITKYREFRNNPAHKYIDTLWDINRVGSFLLNANRTDDAIQIFKLNVEAYPNSVFPYQALGNAFARKGDNENALQSYQKALQIDPKFQPSIDAIARIKK